MGAFYCHGLTLIQAWISNYIHYEVWDWIIYPFPNFKGAVTEALNGFISQFNAHVIFTHDQFWPSAIAVACIYVYVSTPSLSVQKLITYWT